MRCALAVILVVMSIGPVRAEPLCIAYGPSVRLTGRVHRERAASGLRTSYDILVLDDLLCIDRNEVNRQAAERNVASVELMTVGDEHAAPEGVYVAVTGELFHSFAAKHHTSVLLAVDDVEFLE